MLQKGPIIRTGIGQDSHRFLVEKSTKQCIMGGVIFEDSPGFLTNSDGDVIFHAICNAISSLSGEIILGKRADELLEKRGIIDSKIYLQEAIKTLGPQKIVHVALSLECARPRILDRIPELRKTISQAMDLDFSQVGITATSGERLTEFGCGEGVQCFCILTTVEP